MPNHTHLFFRTPQPNLSRGMQYLLSGYANWFSTRHRRPGHLFQGRFKGELIEDESYFWSVSRYVHLNPVRGKRPLVDRPEDWPWTSYPGYRWKRRRLDWVAYDSVLSAWQSKQGGKNSTSAYRRFVDAGLEDPPDNPLDAAVEGWLLGSAAFVKRVKRSVQAPTHGDEVPAARRLAALPLQRVLRAVAEEFGGSVADFAARHSKSQSRDLAAWLARRLTAATLRELQSPFGLRHPDSVRALLNRAEQALSDSPALRRRLDRVKKQLQGDRGEDNT
jgi:hypothetical protein